MSQNGYFEAKSEQWCFKPHWRSTSFFSQGQWWSPFGPQKWFHKVVKRHPIPPPPHKNTFMSPKMRDTYMRLLVRQGLTSRVQHSNPGHKLCSMILPVYDFIQKKMSESQIKAVKREFKCLAHDQQRLFSCLCSKVSVYRSLMLKR